MGELKLAVLASGRGSNFEALVQAAESGRLNARFHLLIISNPNAGAQEIARAHGIPWLCLQRGDFEDRNAFVAAMKEALVQSGANTLALAGYMKKLPPEIIDAYAGSIFNIHPGLLPAFGGQGMFGGHVHQAVLDAGCKVSGVTVHLVDNQYDHGAIVAQRCVPVLPGDDARALAARVLKEEHRLFAEVLQAVAEGRLRSHQSIFWLEAKQ